jgi:hypothetical protein
MFHGFPNAARRVFLAVVLACPVFPVCAQELVPAGEARPTWDLQNNPIPHWTGGFLLPIESPTAALETQVIHAFDDTGREAQPLVFSIPGAKSVLIDAVARGSDGRWALAGRAYDPKGKGGGFISWVSPDEQKVTTVRTYPYDVGDVAIAPDGTTWTYGYEVVYGQEYDRTPDGVIRRFDKSGKQVGSYIPRGGIRGEVDSVGMMYGKLSCTGNRIGWYANQAHVYFELTYDGDKVSRPVSYPGIVPHNSYDGYLTGLALMDNGDVYITASTGRLTKPSESLCRLDRAHRSWVPVTLPDNTDGAFLLGGDGKRLAMFGRNRVVFITPRD